MTRTLGRVALRHLVAHPTQTALALLGIALGVAAVVSIDLANDSARRAFEQASERVGGRATHHVVGGPSGVPDMLYRELRLRGVSRAAPVIESDVALPEHPGRSVRLLGVDPFAESEIRAALTVDTPADRPLAELLTRPRTGLLARGIAGSLGIRSGDEITIRVGARRDRVAILALLRDDAGIEDALVMDIAAAQEVLDAVGRLDRIDLLLPDGAAGTELVTRIAALAPPGVDVVPAGARAHALVEATRAFRVNLTAMSLLTLFVGLFLVYNTMLFSVIQRRTLLGTLRALGVTRTELLALVLGEALLLGVVATAIGLPLGIVLANAMLGLVTQTINDLYFVLAVRDLALSPWVLGKGAALGILGTVLAAVAPAVEAMSTAPRATLARAVIEHRARRAVPWLAAGGGALVATGAALMVGAGRDLIVSYAGLFAAFLGMALVVPAVAVLVMRLVERPLAGALGPTGRMAARGVVASLSRTGVAMSALAIAVAATVGVTVMIGSFRDTVAAWLATSLQADVYVSSPSLVGNRPDATLPPSLLARLRAAPGVAHAGTSRVARVNVDGARTALVTIDPPRAAARAFRFADGRADDAWAAFTAGDVFVSEPLAYRRGLGVGQRLRVRSDRGDVTLRVAAVVRDYGSSEGVILIARSAYDRLWDDRAISSIAIYAMPGLAPAELVRTLRLAAGGDEVLIRPSATIREASLAIFDRTFAVTGVLRLIVTVVAFVGVLAAVMALELDRGRELAVLRAQGVTPGEVWRLVTAQTGLLGLVAGLAAIPVGLALAALLVFVINRRAFGWTLDFALTAAPLAQALGLALAAAVLAGLYPAWRLSRRPLAAALREE